MRVVGADVVLDQQLVAVASAAGGGGVQSRVLALERRGAVQPAHEGDHARAVGTTLRQLPAVRAVDGVGGQLGRQLVQRLVQVHHGQVQAVAAAALAVRQFVELGGVQHRAGERGQLRLPVRHPRGQGGVGAVAFGHRARHGAQVVVQAQRQTRQVGHAHAGCAFARGGGGQVVQPLRLGAGGDVGGGDLARQIQRRLARARGVGGGGLQHAQIELEPVVGLERGAHLGGPQQGREGGAFAAQRRDGIAFFHGEVERVTVAASLRQRRDNAMKAAGSTAGSRKKKRPAVRALCRLGQWPAAPPGAP